jgi:hypothetical protein
MKGDEKNIDDQELDAVFREAARSHSPDFQESDWLVMSGMLDKFLGSEPKNGGFNFKKRWLLGLLLGLAFVGSIGWLYVNNLNDEVTASKAVITTDSEIVSEEKRATTVIENQPLIKTETANTDSEKDRESGDVTVSTSNLSEGTKADFNEKSAAIREANRINSKQLTDESAIPQNLKNSLRSEISEGEKSNAITSSPTAISGNSKQISGSENVTSRSKENERGKSSSRNRKQTEFSGSTIDNNLSEVIDEPKEVVERTAIVSIPKFERTNFGVISLLMPQKAHVETKLELPAIHNHYLYHFTKFEDIFLSEPPAFHKGLSVRLAYSPDFSTVNSDFFKIGNNSAFLIEHRFNNRFVIQSGVIKSVKKYSANPADYKWPEQWGQTPNSLTDITAICDMLDIPLNLRFDISQKSNQRLFVAAGTTNYLMINELYEYDYYGASGALLSSWEGRTGFYAFSVLNFSAGFEKRISRKISLQVEPFVKLPVRDLGFGKVRLTTLGIFASAKIKL